MKNYPRHATPAVLRDYAMERSATSAREKAIACLLTANSSQFRNNSDLGSVGNARVGHKTLSIPVERLTASEAKPTVPGQ
jgi:hypothetical protein